jgi:hypothetical protein
MLYGTAIKFRTSDPAIKKTRAYKKYKILR